MIKKFFSKVKNYIVNARRMMQIYSRANSKSFAVLMISIIAVSLLPFINAYLFKLVIDKLVVAIKTSDVNLEPFVILLSAVYISDLLIRLFWKLIEYHERLCYLDAGRYIELMVEEKFSKLGFEHFSNPKLNDLLNRVRETYTWRPLNFANRQLWVIQNIIEIVSNTLAILALNVWIFLLVLVSTIPELIVKMKYGREVWNIHVAKGDIRRDFWNTAYYLKRETYLEEIRIFGSAKYFIDRIKKLYDTFFNEQKKKEKQKFNLSILSSLSTFAAFTVSQIFIVFLTIRQIITLGSLEFYNGRIYRLSESLQSFFRNIGIGYEDLLYVNDLFRVLELKNKIEDSKDSLKIEARPYRIEFKNVTFRYPRTKKNVLERFNLVINPNEKVALIGENGGGKTTIIRLLCRFYDVDKGEILIDGINIKEINLESWYRCLGVLFQDFNRYSYSVRDNIRVGDIDKKFEKKIMNEAMKKSQATHFVDEYKQKDKTRLSKEFEKGVEPSVGQWQRIALARAFFRDSPILVLDEPTASIDAKAEADIFKQLESFEKDKTVIMVSHRFSTVRNADRIYVVDDGRIKEQGTHEELMNRHGKYAKLFNLQAKGYK
ncbi:MAG: ABC transporter ATP-binding protein [Candidatus Dojkabacteria bacterium]|nr:ABC transporter ATP-binding protein [Candidatus Dojkabacteria bacterium]